MSFDKIYLDLAKEIITNGDFRYNKRTQQATFSLFGTPQYTIDLTDDYYPLLETKKIHLPSMHHELLWFLKGNTNIEYLVQNNVRIWNEWPFERYKSSKEYRGETIEEFAQEIKENPNFAREWGDAGPIYGKQWRSWETKDGKEIDQLKKVIQTIKKDKGNRRLIVSSWNVGEIEEMSLPPCHVLYQFSATDKHLDCKLYQRSADWLLGVPFNAPSYSLLTRLVANETQLTPRRFIHTFGDAHIYSAGRERGEFYKENKEKLVKEIKKAMWPEDYLNIRNWIMQKAPLNQPKRRKNKIILEDHLPFLLTQLSRQQPVEIETKQRKPKLKIKDNKGPFNIEYSDIIVEDYSPEPTLDFEFQGEIYTPGIAI